MEEDRSIIVWKSPKHSPEEGSYILLKCLDEGGAVVCEPAAFEAGRFVYIYDRDCWGEVNNNIILGWAYYPFDERA